MATKKPNALKHLKTSFKGVDTSTQKFLLQMAQRPNEDVSVLVDEFKGNLLKDFTKYIQPGDSERITGFVSPYLRNIGEKAEVCVNTYAHALSNGTIGLLDGTVEAEADLRKSVKENGLEPMVIGSAMKGSRIAGLNITKDMKRSVLGNELMGYMQNKNNWNAI
jgi:hypothetical protein